MMAIPSTLSMDAAIKERRRLLYRWLTLVSDWCNIPQTKLERPKAEKVEIEFVTVSLAMNALYEQVETMKSANLFPAECDSWLEESRYSDCILQFVNVYLLFECTTDNPERMDSNAKDWLGDVYRIGHIPFKGMQAKTSFHPSDIVFILRDSQICHLSGGLIAGAPRMCDIHHSPCSCQ